MNLGVRCFSFWEAWLKMSYLPLRLHKNWKHIGEMSTSSESSEIILHENALEGWRLGPVMFNWFQEEAERLQLINFWVKHYCYGSECAVQPCSWSCIKIQVISHRGLQLETRCGCARDWVVIREGRWMCPNQTLHWHGSEFFQCPSLAPVVISFCWPAWQSRGLNLSSGWCN